MRIFCCLLWFFFVSVARGESMLGYYRFPTIYKDTIVFTAEGDLWKIQTTGGIAQRLTTHHGVESNAAISPDGSLIAFSAQYEGPTEIYTIPINGGLPKRWTYEGENALVVGWTHENKIIYATNHYSTLPDTQLVTIDLKDGSKARIPLSQASQGTFPPNSNTLYFTRLPFQGSHTKRYKGGTAQNIWKFTLDSKEEAIPLTSDYPGTSKNAMWWKGKIYFASDRDGTMNLWSMNKSGKSLTQLTHHEGWDIKSPAIHNGQIVYQLGADLHLFHIANNTDEKLKITLATDFEQKRERWVTSPTKYLTSTQLSPNADRIAFTARGQVFVVPTKTGRLIEATRQNGVRYRKARFMPDGKELLALSDETGEVEFWKIPANGVGKREQITNNGDVLRFSATPSADGKWFAFSDKNLKLWICNIKQKKPLLIDTNQNDGFYHLRWSPDSKWLAFVAFAENSYPQIKLYNLKTKTMTTLTSDRVDSYNPSWSADGKWLYFLSDRHFKSIVSSPWGPRQPEPYFDKTTKLYMIALQKFQRSPFQAPDELFQEKEKKKDKDKDNETSKPPKIEIDLEDIQKRVYEVPVSPGRYSSLSNNKEYIYWIERETSYDPPKNLLSLEIKNDQIKTKTLVEKIDYYQLSQDGKKILVKKEGQFYLFDATQKPEKLDKHKINLKEWAFSFDPREEWKQMLIEAWRLERDYFYDRNLHGVNWEKVLKKHLPLIERITDREELSDLIANMVGELSALHIFVTGGDKRAGKDNIGIASLGALLEKDKKAGGYRIQHIYQNDPDYLDLLSPLAKQGLRIKVGDIIEEINGVSTLSVPHLAILLRNKEKQQVLLKIKAKATGKKFSEIVKPISAKAAKDLRYREWEYQRRLLVDKKSNNEIGYVHLRAMGGENFSEWIKNFYPIYQRKGLIVDVRHNNGGNIDSWILEKLLRKAWFYWQPRVGDPHWNMQYAFRGHIVVISDEWTASDGEAFAEGFRRLEIGKIIGVRSWGGEIWLSFNNWLVDKGIASAAETGVYGPEGQWLIEGHGVEPDIVVDNLPHATFKGEDAQLARAIKHLQELIKKHPVEVPKTPKHPDKSFKYNK